MKLFVPLAAALLVAGPATAKSSHAAHHPAGKPPATAMSHDKACPKMGEMSGNMHQMMGQMAQMMQMMQSMQQQHQGMGMGSGMAPSTEMPKSPPPSDGKPH